MGDPLASYLSCLRSRFAVAGPGMEVIDEPGAVGVLGVDGTEPLARVVVTDDSLAPQLSGWLASGRLFGASVIGPAPRCEALLARAEGCYPPETSTAMVHSALQHLPVRDLPVGLRLEIIDEAQDGVSLEAAVEMAFLADPAVPEGLRPDDFAEYLRRLPASSRFVVAVDETGAVRGTAASSVSGASAGVFFVATHPAWCRRGVATAMTSAALVAARDGGATAAALDASGEGLAIYRRLGFQEAGTVLAVTRHLA